MPSGFSRLRLFVTLWSVAHQAFLSMGFQSNTGVGCHGHLQEILSPQGSKPHALHLHWQVGSLPLALPGKPYSLPRDGNES